MLAPVIKRNFRSRKLLSAPLLFAAVSLGLAGSVPAYAQPLNASWIPFILVGNLVSLNVTVDGKGPFRFILDTGAEVSVITPALAKRLGEHSEQRVLIEGAGTQETSGGFTQAHTLTIGTTEYRQRILYIVSLPPEFNDVPRGMLPIQGMLGFDVLRTVPITVDYEKSRLRMTPLITLPTVGKMPLELSEHHVPLIRAVVDGRPGAFKVDSGDGGSLTLYRPFVNRNGLESRYRPKFALVTGRGVGGDVRSASAATQSVPAVAS